MPIGKQQNELHIQDDDKNSSDRNTIINRDLLVNDVREIQTKPHRWRC